MKRVLPVLVGIEGERPTRDLGPRAADPVDDRADDRPRIVQCPLELCQIVACHADVGAVPAPVENETRAIVEDPRREVARDEIDRLYSPSIGQSAEWVRRYCHGFSSTLIPQEMAAGLTAPPPVPAGPSPRRWPRRFARERARPHASRGRYPASRWCRR